MEWKWGAKEGGRDEGGGVGLGKRIDGAHGQHWNTGWRARAPSSDRKRNLALIRPLPLVNWTRQLSCQVINSLRKFSALSPARLILRSGSISNLRCVPNACWIHLSPSTLSLHWTIHLHYWAHPTPYPNPLLPWVRSFLSDLPPPTLHRVRSLDSLSLFK